MALPPDKNKGELLLAEEWNSSARLLRGLVDPKDGYSTNDDATGLSARNRPIIRWTIPILFTVALTAGSVYKGRRALRWLQDVPEDVSVDLHSLLQFSPIDDCVIINREEVGLAQHEIDVGVDNGFIGWCFYTGRFSTPSKLPVYELEFTQLPVPQYQYMPVQAVAQNVLGGDWARAHQLI